MGSCMGKLSNEQKEKINMARKNSKNIEEKNMKAEKEAEKEHNEFIKSYMDLSKQADYIIKKSKGGLNVTKEDFKQADTFYNIAKKNSDKFNKRQTDDFNNE